MIDNQISLNNKLSPKQPKQLESDRENIPNFNQNKRIFKKLLKLTTISLFSIISLTSTANAHTKCRVNLGWGNWTEGCVHTHSRKPSDTFHDGGQHYSYNSSFDVVNYTNSTISYSVGGRSYRLRKNYKRRHTIQVKRNHKTNAQIKFDKSYSSGYQSQIYNLSGVTKYSRLVFRKVGSNNIDAFWNTKK